MGSDKARVTYDPMQQYRSVVMQQGRVTLEADWNEAAQIAAEELRHETRDLVGPFGTPDNGYQVVLASGSPAVYNQIQFVIVTGSDDLRTDSSVNATLLSPLGAVLQVIALKAINQPAWGTNSTHTVTATLLPVLSAGSIGSVVLSLTSHDLFFEPTDIWNITSISVRLTSAVATPLPLLAATGNPLARLTSAQPTLILTAPVATSAYDFTIESGTMYLGGVRATLPYPITYSSQPDWLNYNLTPDPQDLSDDARYWTPPGRPGSAGLTTSAIGSPDESEELIYLYLREQEISAVEDPSLADVALGGPDTAARTRLIQHIARVASTGSDCASGMTAAQSLWAAQGVYFDSSSMRLQSESTLLVGFSDLGQSSSLCQPQAQGGYLDPDNQLIRVQVSGIDPLTGNPMFVWGFDNASFLYRISFTDASTMVLQSVPPDTNHQPASGQAVEILRSAVELDATGAYVAAPSGFVVTLDQNYDQDAHTVQLPGGTSLPSEYLTSHQSPPTQLYLRVWQQEVVFTPGEPVALGDTGLLVTLQTSLTFHTGDFWHFAVRPSTPQNIYPPRYQMAPQSPDGPRIWACPLAVVQWSGTTGTIVSDCRPKFGPAASRALHINDISWPNDDLVSLADFRNTPLQIAFDFPAAAQSLKQSLTVTIEVPSGQFLNGYLGNQFHEAAQTGNATLARAITAGTASLPVQNAAFSTQLSSGITGINTGTILNVGNLINLWPINFHVSSLPDSLLASFSALINAASLTSTPTPAVGVTGFTGLIQPGTITSTLNTVNWAPTLPLNNLIPYFSQAGVGGALKVRVSLKGRDVWSGSSNPLVYLDGQAFGEPALRADKVTPCTDLILPSGEGARASDFESWFWLSLLVWGQTDVPIGDLPLCMTTADFNNDGFTDIAVATISGAVYILLNDGTGKFTTKPPVQAGAWPLSIIAVTFDHGTNVDIALTSYTNGTATILMGKGDGTFTVAPSSPLNVGLTPWGLVAGDFSGTGNIDLAVANASGGTVSILINNGNVGTNAGAFSNPVPIKVGTTPTNLVAGKFGSNQNVDIAVLNSGSNNVMLLMNSGKAAFTVAANPIGLPSGASALPLSILAADFNKDGFPDLAIGGISQQTGSAPQAYVNVFVNNPQSLGTFEYYDFATVSGIPGSLAAQDFNGDGNLDIVATGASFLGGSSTFSVLIGNGDGTFQSQVVYPIEGGANPIAVVSADFNHDGVPDLAMCTEAGKVSILLNEQGQIATAANQVQITGYSAVQPVHVGDQIEIDGYGFLVPSVLNQVSIGGAVVTNLSSSQNSATRLFFNVPSIPGATPAGTPVTVTVSNANGTATSPFQLVVQAAVVAPVGKTQLLYADPPVMPVSQPNITAGQVYTFTFALTAVTNLTATYALTVSITGAGWAAQIVGANSVQVAANQSANVTIKVTAAAGTGQVTLSAVETTTGGTVAPGNVSLLITAGSPPPAPQTAIKVTLSDANLGAKISGTGVNLTPNALGIIAFGVLLTNAGNGYTATASLLAPTGWTLGAIGGVPFNVQPAPPVGQPANTTITALLTAGAGAVATTLVLNIQAPDGTVVSFGLPITVG